MQDSTPITTRHLDGLRIVAASGVVVLHYADYIKDTPPGQFLVAHTWHFNLFVDLFFVISGFVIASQYAGRVGTPAMIARFLARRLARIYPLHLATLAFYVALAAALAAGLARTDNPARYPLSDLPAQLLLLHAIDGQRLTFNFPSWSLSAEFFCYALFPLMALLVARRRVAALALVVLPMAANSLYAAAAGTPPWADWINQGGAFRALPAFNLGIACHLYRRELARLPMAPGLLAATLLLFILFGARLPVMAALAVVYGIAVVAIQHDCAGRATLFTALGLDRWSDLTYASYMLHIPVATVVLTFGARLLPLAAGRLMLLPAAIVVLAGASVLSLRYIETPARRALNNAYDRHVGPRLAARGPARRALS